VDDYYVGFQSSVRLHSCFEGLVEFVYVVNDFLDVTIGGVFVFYYLNLSPSSVCGVSDEACLRVCGIATGSDDVGSVVSRSVLWV